MMTKTKKKQSQKKKPPKDLSERLKRVRRRIEEGYYNHDPAIEEIVDAFLETQSSDQPR